MVLQSNMRKKLTIVGSNLILFVVYCAIWTYLLLYFLCFRKQCVCGWYISLFLQTLAQKYPSLSSSLSCIPQIAHKPTHIFHSTKVHKRTEGRERYSKREKECVYERERKSEREDGSGKERE